MDPTLAGASDKLDWFLVFGHMYREGQLAARGRGSQPVRHGAVEEALRAVGTRFTHLGLPDPRKDAGGHYVPRLQALVQAYKRDDPEPTRTWPVTLTILHALLSLPVPALRAVEYQLSRDLAIVGFYFLCRPGEYAASRSGDQGRSSPFHLQDVSFRTGAGRYLAASKCSLNDVWSGTKAVLTYTDQKNAVRGESIGHSLSGDPWLCPVRALQRLVSYHKDRYSPPDTPLYTYYDIYNNKPEVTTSIITYYLRSAAATVQQHTGVSPTKIQAYGLRSGGATTLLCAGVGETVVELVGRWKSDAMRRYLRAHAHNITTEHAKLMLQHGHFTFDTNASDSPTVPLPQQATKDLRTMMAPILVAA